MKQNGYIKKAKEFFELAKEEIEASKQMENRILQLMAVRKHGLH